MSQITTHVLDTSAGKPAAGIDVTLEQLDPTGANRSLARATTDADGRVGSLGPEQLTPGGYQLRFDTGSYHASRGETAFFPEVVVCFRVSARDHYHVPLLLSRYGYSTYRGS